ncbi:hypothetical protein BaRGS_00013677 [Batillaria attramentaria]|uniref:Uncharacterized protein n=1 Tax=Batillaria attramentaria TaxID=370345 RepID=A0ABD0L6P4_9CAEN
MTTSRENGGSGSSPYRRALNATDRAGPESKASAFDWRRQKADPARQDSTFPFHVFCPGGASPVGERCQGAVSILLNGSHSAMLC